MRRSSRGLGRLRESRHRRDRPGHLRSVRANSKGPVIRAFAVATVLTSQNDAAPAPGEVWRSPSVPDGSLVAVSRFGLYRVLLCHAPLLRQGPWGRLCPEL